MRERRSAFVGFNESMCIVTRNTHLIEWHFVREVPEERFRTVVSRLGRQVGAHVDCAVLAPEVLFQLAVEPLVDGMCLETLAKVSERRQRAEEHAFWHLATGVYHCTQNASSE